MTRIFEGISSYLKKTFETDEWDTDDEGDRTIAFRLGDDEGREWDGAVLVDEESAVVVFYSTMLDTVPKDRLHAVMELVTRANFALPVGKFELDLDDGEVCFATALDLEGVELTEPMIANLVRTNLGVMGAYHDALRGVMEGEMTALEAIESVEEDEDYEDDDFEDDEDGDDDDDEDEEDESGGKD